MSPLNSTNEYNRLYEQYYNKSNEELSEIIKPENGYTEIAIKAASDILRSDRTAYYEKIKHENQIIDDQTANNEDILFEIGEDIHSIKNMLLFFVILTISGFVLGMVYGFYIYFRLY